MVNVTKENFIEQSNDLLRNLPTAAFVAIDEEMTGISVERAGQRPPKDKTPAERYSTLKQAPERYSIIQLGVALFHPAASGNSHQQQSSSSQQAASAAGRGYASVVPPHASPVPTRNGNMTASEYTVRRYNFYMFPAPTTSSSGRGDEDEREVVLNPSTVEFLHKHNMSFDLWSRQGVPFVTTSKAQELLDSYIAKEECVASSTETTKPSVQLTIRRRVELRRNEDIDFFARAMASLREWLDSAHGEANEDEDDDHNDDEGEEDGVIGEGTSFLMPPCNSFLRRALYESIEQEYPTLELENGGNQQIRVWRLNAEEKAARKRRLCRERWEELIGQKLGVWRVFEALRCACSGLEIRRSSVLFADSYDQINWDNPGHEAEETAPQQEESSSRRKIPIIVHNGFMDILFLLTHFHSIKLPDSYKDCKDLISRHFPIIYDTKVMATESNCWGTNGNDQNSYTTNLSNLFQRVVREPMAGEHQPLLDQIRVEHSRSSVPVVEDQEHEAAYDAFMTGAIFLGLCRRIQQISTVSPNFVDVVSSSDSMEARMFYCRNMLYQMSMYTMDLEESQSNRDPMSKGMLPETTYRVAGIDKAVTTRDIVRCISGLTDSVGRQIQFEIVWIDDTTFLVAASFRINGGERVGAGDAEMEAILRDHGHHIFRALRERFQHESIVVLEDHLRALDAAQQYRDTKQNGGSWMDGVLSIFGFRNKRAREDTEQAANKRHRST